MGRLTLAVLAWAAALHPAVLLEHEPMPRVAVVAGGQATRTLTPVDEAVAAPDFFSFRAQLLMAIARRDAAALLAIVDPNIKNGFGGDDGKAAFARTWRPSASDSRVWETLAAVLALGGTRWGDDEFVAPYVFAAWPRGVDGFEHVAVIGDGVRVRRAPAAEAAEIAQVSFSVLKRGQDDKAPEEWTAVTLPDGRAGYVSSKYVRSPIDYRAAFSKKDGRWWMVMLLAGD